MFAFPLLLLFFLLTTLTTHRPLTIDFKDRVRLRQLLQNWNVNFKMSNSLRSEKNSDVTYWWMHPLNCTGRILISCQLLIQTLNYEASTGHCFPKLLWILGEPSSSSYNIAPIPFDNTREWKKKGDESESIQFWERNAGVSKYRFDIINGLLGISLRTLRSAMICHD